MASSRCRSFLSFVWFASAATCPSRSSRLSSVSITGWAVGVARMTSRISSVRPCNALRRSIRSACVSVSPTFSPGFICFFLVMACLPASRSFPSPRGQGFSCAVFIVSALLLLVESCKALATSFSASASESVTATPKIFRSLWVSLFMADLSVETVFIAAGQAGVFSHLKLYRIRRCTAARAPLAPVLQFVAHVRQGLLTRGAGYLDGAECRTGMTNEPSAVPHSAESASCFHDGSPFWPTATTLGWPSSTFPLMPSARPRRSAHEQDRSPDREARPRAIRHLTSTSQACQITAIVPAPVLWVK